MEMGQRLAEIKKSRRGTTMVSVIVAFVLLMLAVMMLYTAVITSMNLLTKARRNEKKSAWAVEEFYKDYKPEGGTGTISLSKPAAATYDGFSVKGFLNNEVIKVSGEAEGETETITFYYYQYPSPSAAESE